MNNFRATKFSAEREVTIVNSVFSKTLAAYSLTNSGLTNLHWILTPGPAWEREQKEHANLLDSYEQDEVRPTIELYPCEVDPQVAKHYGIPDGEFVRTSKLIIAGLEQIPGRGVVLEFDQTYNVDGLLRRGIWEEYLELLHFSASKFPTVAMLTHGVRSRYPLQLLLKKPMQSEDADQVPFQSWFSEQITTVVGVEPKLLWSSRNYHQRRFREEQIRTSSPGAPCYRWVWRIS